MLEMNWISMGGVSALSTIVKMLDSLSENTRCGLSTLTIPVPRGANQRTESPPHGRPAAYGFSQYEFCVENV